MPVHRDSSRPATSDSVATLQDVPPLSMPLASQKPLQDTINDNPIKPIIDDVLDAWAHDPMNPRNWSLLKKYSNMALVSFYTFIPPLASSMIAPGLPRIAQHYSFTSPTIFALTLTIFLLSFALAPLIIAPLSEMYGRTWVYHIGNIASLAFSLGCAFAPNIGTLLGLRFLAGASGAAPIAIGGGTVSDLFSEKDRASAMAMYTLGPLLGPVIGPIIGGFVAETIGFKYVFIIIAGLCGVASAIAIPCLRETYAPVIRIQLGRALADSEKAAASVAIDKKSKMIYLWSDLSRPLMLLVRSFICFILSLYMALMYGIYYLMFTTFPTLFSDVYGFSIGMSGLAYLGLGIGFFSATIFGASLSDKVYAYLVAKNNGVGKPEMRIPSLIFGSLFVPVGLFWYGWSAEAKIHWIMPIIGTGIFGFGLMTTFLPIQLYLVDSFTFAASAVSAASVFRSLLGFAFPLFGTQMFAALGIGGGNSLLAGLAIVIGIPFPIWIWYKGEEIRLRSPLNR